MAFLIGGANTTSTAAYDVANSCRFDGADSLQRSKGTQSSLQIGTYSFWVKRTNIDGTQHFVYSNTVADDNNRGYYSLRADEKFRIVSTASSGDLTVETSQLFRDPSAWMNIVVRIDTTQGTAANRCIFYVNGVAVTALDTTTYPDQNANLKIFEGGESNKEFIGGMTGETSNLHCYLSEFVYCDGQSLAPTSFGEFNEDSPTIWQPIDVSGLTFGDQGFYLDFEDSSALGNSSNSNNFGTVNNLAATDSNIDTPTNNFSTMNPLDNYFAGATFSEGNLKFVHGSSAWTYNTSNIGVANGRWYCEMKCVDAGSSGIGLQPTVGIASGGSTAASEYLGKGAYDWGWRAFTDQQNVLNNQSEVLGSMSTWTDDDILGIYLDCEDNKLYLAKNGTLENTDGISLTAPASTDTGFYFFAAGDNKDNVSATWEANFGSPSFSISSGNADDNGYGSFEYSPNITGDSTAKSFYAVCTKNLAEFG